jgi:hypothetical protein
MTRIVLHRRKPLSVDAAEPEAAPSPPAEFDLEGLLPQLRQVWVQVPCAGCGGSHEMTCAELLTRQVLRGATFPSEECDDGAVLGAILSPEDVMALRGNIGEICAALKQRGVLCAPHPDSDAGGVFTPGHEPRHILLAH